MTTALQGIDNLLTGSSQGRHQQTARSSEPAFSHSNRLKDELPLELTLI